MCYHNNRRAGNADLRKLTKKNTVVNSLKFAGNIKTNGSVVCKCYAYKGFY